MSAMLLRDRTRVRLQKLRDDNVNVLLDKRGITSEAASDLVGYIRGLRDAALELDAEFREIHK